MSTSRSMSRIVARGVAILATGRFLAAGLALVSLSIMAAGMRASDLGAYSFGLSFVALFAFLPQLGTSIVARDIAQRPELEATLVPNAVYIRVLLGIVGYAALAVGLQVLGYSAQEKLAALVAGTVLFLYPLGAFGVVLQVRMRQGWPALGSFLAALLTLVTAAYLVEVHASLLAFAAAYVIANAIGVIVSVAAVLRIARFDWRPRLRLWWPLTTTALPLTLAALLTTVYFRIDMAFLARMQPASDVAQYGVAYKLLDGFLLIPSVLMSVMFPVLAKSVVDGVSVLERRYRTTIRLSVMVAAPVAVAAVLTAARALPSLPGYGRYEGAGQALAFLAVAGCLSFLGSVVQNTLIAGGAQRRLLPISSVALVANVVLNLSLIPRFSYMGAAFATAATEVLALTLSSVSVARIVGVRWPWRALRGMVSPLIAMGLALAAMGGLEVWAQLGLGFAVYAAALVASRQVQIRPVGRGRRTAGQSRDARLDTDASSGPDAVEPVLECVGR